MMIGASQAWSELGRNARRSSLSILSISLGVASVLIMNSLTEGNRVQAMKSLARMGGVSVITVSSLPPKNPGEEIRYSRSPGLTYAQMAGIMASESRIETLLPEGLHAVQLLASPERTARGRVVAVSWEHFAQFNIGFDTRLPRSRLAEDWRRGAEICLLGEKLAESLFGNAEKAVGRTVLYDGVSLEVAGIIKGANRFDWRMYQCIYPWTAYTRRFSSPFERMEEIKVKLRDGTDPGSARASVSRLLLAAHRGVEDFAVRTAEDEIASTRKANRTIKFLGAAISFLALAVGTIGILNLMMATIGSRIRELGVRKALGASNSCIMAQFVMESVSISCVGTLLGLGLGVLPALFPEGTLPVPPTYSLSDCLVAVCAGVSAGLVSGLYPAAKAAGLSPTEALRNG